MLPYASNQINIIYCTFNNTPDFKTNLQTYEKHVCVYVYVSINFDISY